MGFPKVLIFLVFLSFSFCISAAERRSYIVHMDKSQMPQSFADNHHQWYLNTIHSLESADMQGSPEHLYTYDHVFHGFSAVLSESELENIKNSPGFVSAYIDRILKPQTTHSLKFLNLNPSTGVWPASDYGKDVIIGVIDTGVWPEHPSFGDDGMTEIPSRWKGGCENAGHDFNSSLCNKKLIGAKYFDKGVKAASPGIKYSTRDTDGHGTHVASIAGGNYVPGASFFGYAPGTATGVAPRARLAVYKVLYDEGSHTTDILAGINEAVADGVDVTSLSIGYKNNIIVPLYEDPIAIASFGAMEKGILVSSSAGNEEPRNWGLNLLGRLQKGIPWVLTVAAGSIDRWFAGTLTLGNGEKIIGWSMFPVKALVSNSTLVFNEAMSPCNSTDRLFNVTGTVICDDVDSFLAQRVFISISKTLDAAIFISSTFRFDDAGFPFPGVIISPEDGARVKNYAQNVKNPTISMEFQETLLGKTRAPLVAQYTLRGPSPTCPGILKPDIMAPGTLILAAWIPETAVSLIGSNIRLPSQGYNLIQGTSMACPHASGIAALLKGVHPEWSPAAIRSAMVTTANPLDNHGDPIKDSGINYEPANPTSMGAGQVDPNRAMDPGLIYDAGVQDYIELLCSMNFTKQQITTIAKSFKCSGKSPDLNYPSFIVLYGNDTKGIELSQMFERTVTNVGNGPTSYKVRVSAPKGSTVTVLPERLVFGEKNEKQKYTLSIKYQAGLNQSVASGSVVWVEENGKHRVRSPIAVAPMVPVW